MREYFAMALKGAVFGLAAGVVLLSFVGWLARWAALNWTFVREFPAWFE